MSKATDMADALVKEQLERRKRLAGITGGGEDSMLGSFKKGGTVPKTGVYKLHKGEKVIPAAPAPKVKQYISESHDYDSSRPKKPGRSQYKGAAGTAY
jgi:hypothetical protein